MDQSTRAHPASPAASGIFLNSAACARQDSPPQSNAMAWMQRLLHTACACTIGVVH